MQPLRTVLVYGSVREGRFCGTVARWASARIAARSEFELEIVDPEQAPERSRAASSIAQRLARAEAFVVVTPEYNHGYPAALKALIDAHYAQWQAKPVGFVSYGGASGGLRAVEQLRQVFAELHAVTVRDAVYFSHASRQFDGHGRLREPDAAQRAMAMMLARLRWWGLALRHARGSAPYAQAVA